VVVAACALLLPATGEAATAEQDGRDSATAGADSELNLLLLEVALDNARLVDVLSGYQSGDDILLPVGELARLLTIGITVDPATQTASGFLLNESQPFRLELDSGTVVLPSGREAYDPRLVRWIDGDLYAASGLLERWWPIDFSVDMASLRLNLVAREKLPLQAKLEREMKAKLLSRNGAASERDLGYPYLRPDYDLLSVPFIDSTLALDLRGSGDHVTVNAAYSGFLTGDLLGMEAAAYLAVSREDQKPEARITLARHDPEAGLLGPLEARSVALGSIGVPAVDNVLRGAGVGNGVLVSNRPLNLPSSYRSETLRGELPPGWDVTLYFNDALVGFQQARGDGLYEFPDQPLIYGRNEFRLVFNGPLGQTRVEREVFQLDERLIAPGEFFYVAAVQRDDDRGSRQTLQVDFSAFEDFGVTLGGVYVDEGTGSPGQGYANAGARIALPGALVTLDYVYAIDGGSLVDFGIHTSIAGMSIEASRIWMDDFHSDFFVRRSDPIEVRDRLRMTGTLTLSESWKLPVAFDLEREKYASGEEALKIQQRLSANVWGASFTNLLEWRTANGLDRFGGVLQVSRRLAGFGLSGQAAYSFMPQARLNSFALSVDKNIGISGRAFLSVLHDLEMRRTALTGGFNRNFGSFGVGISGMFAGRGDYGLGLQLFTAIGRNPRTGEIVSDWRPMASSGTVAAQVFIDDNQNGIFDEGEDPVEGAAFRINGGSRHPARTDTRGVAVLNRLPPKDYVDIGLDPGTLEDAQLQPAVPGVRILPRPGKAEKVDFPIVLTGEIDGTVHLVENGNSRGIGSAVVELLNEAGELIGSTQSASDGFYVLSGVKPGRYYVRISPAQIQELGLAADGAVSVLMPADPDFISGIDFQLIN
jgi:hypothetical protein